MKLFTAIKCLAIGSVVTGACACSRGAATAQTSTTPSADSVKQVPAFSADSAYSYVARQVAFGPRIANSQAHAQCSSWLAAELKRHGADTVIVQEANLPDFGPMSNIMGQFDPSNPRRILLLAHWDSRPWADQDPDPKNHKTPIDGANDGASGVGVLIEVARILGQNKAPIGVDILFVDAEDAGNEGDEDSWARGAQYWAENMPYGSNPMPFGAILLDMVGGKGAVFPREMFSDYNAKPLLDAVWQTAARVGLGNRFPNRVGGAVNDDHVPLLRAGIPAIDIIETENPQTGSFNPTWHTLQDNLENIDPATLGDVGTLITNFLYNGNN